MAAADDEQLAALIRPSGPTTRKVQTLKAVLALAPCRRSLDSFLAGPEGEVRDALLAIPGIGEETADTILLYAAQRPAFIIDAYTRRIYSRVGMGPGEDAPNPEWKAFFDEYLEPDAELFGHIHALIVEHAKNLCRKQSPRCNRCVLQHRCQAAPPHLARIYERAATR
jgi:endonuclease-3 related protein